ncbi:type II toxin-antitoxin system RelB/DinJ family antitoxin [Weissella confusa]|nr:type II toxin-antitoxin system RelB/DinJ family antitoxin [Weissella confusa]
MKEQSTDRLSIRINSEVKQQASEILEELGLDLSSAVNVF